MPIDKDTRKVWAVREIDDRLEHGKKLDPNQVAMITGFALRLARLINGPEWVKWSLNVHRQQVLIPTSAVIDRLEEIEPRARGRPARPSRDELAATPPNRSAPLLEGPRGTGRP